MKTTYQKLNKYGLSAIVFGKSKKKDFVVFWLLIVMIFLIGIII
jgi:hypothetical protein